MSSPSQVMGKSRKPLTTPALEKCLSAKGVWRHRPLVGVSSRIAMVYAMYIGILMICHWVAKFMSSRCLRDVLQIPAHKWHAAARALFPLLRISCIRKHSKYSIVFLLHSAELPCGMYANYQYKASRSSPRRAPPHVRCSQLGCLLLPQSSGLGAGKMQK